MPRGLEVTKELEDLLDREPTKLSLLRGPEDILNLLVMKLEKFVEVLELDSL